MIQTFSKGLLEDNPIFMYLLGLCPVLAVSTRVIDAIAMGLTLFVILVLTSAAASALNDHIPARFWIFVCTLIAGACASAADLFLQAFFPGASDALGVFVPLLTVNSLIMDRALGFAKENTPGMSFWDAVGMGAGFFFSILGLAVIREVLGAGTITLFPVGNFSGVFRIPGLSQSPLRAVCLSAGGFLALGYLKAIFELARPSFRQKEKEAP